MTEEKSPSLLSDAITYPFRGSGWMMIAIGAVLSAVLGFGAAAPLIGVAAWFAGLSYFTAFYFDIILTTVNGSDESPDWPDITDIWGDIFMPVLRSAGVWLISFLPFLIAVGWMDHEKSLLSHPLAWVTLLWGAFYFPMAMLNVVVGSEMAGALPHRVLPDAVRAMPGYLLVVALLAGVFGISEIAAVYGSKVPFFGGLLTAGISLYFMMVQARLAGMFYRRRLEAEYEEDFQATGPVAPGETVTQTTNEISL